jgi:hypothetical protein
VSPIARLLPNAGTARTLARAVRAHDGSPRDVVRRLRELRRRGFTAREAEAFGLLDPRLPAAQLDRFVSRRDAYAVQDRLNPESVRALVEDKPLFARACAERDLPTPAILALFRREGPGWTPGGGAPEGAAEWERLIREDLPGEFVLKPAWGHLGKGVRVISRAGDGGGFAEAGGGPMTAADLHAAMAGDPHWPEWIVQERVRNHPDLRRLSGTEAVQTVRVLTLLERGGAVRVLWADLRVVMGDAQIDNWRDGTTGNGLAPVDLATGRLGPVVAPRPGGTGTATHDAHPRTGVRLDGVTVPGWADALALVERAARALAPMRALGWDVVPAEDGPLLLEAQARWGPHNQSRAMPGIMAALRAELRAPR